MEEARAASSPRRRRAVAAAVLLLMTVGAGHAQDLTGDRKAAHDAAANEAIAWNTHLAEAVNVGLTTREHDVVSIAVFEAANAITRRYEPYARHLRPRPGASVDAAVASAAYQTLKVVWPRNASLWDALYEHSVARIPDGPAKGQGIDVGKEAAEVVLALRAEDVPFPGPAPTVQPGPGVWRPNEPELSAEQAGAHARSMGLPPITGYAYWKPWTLRAKSQFRAGAPPDLASHEYAADLNEVKAYGAFDSKVRTADQTAEAFFFMTPAPQIFEPLSPQLATRHRLDVTDSARSEKSIVST